jgi:hypothetical protein
MGERTKGIGAEDTQPTYQAPLSRQGAEPAADSVAERWRQTQDLCQQTTARIIRGTGPPQHNSKGYLT